VRLTRKVEQYLPLSRRSFLRASAGAAGGLLVSLHVDPSASAAEGTQAPRSKAYPPEAFIHIRPDGRIAIMVNRVECGQGVHTALPMILADEMDADWSQVVADLAPAAEVYKDAIFGLQMTGGSLAVANSFQQYRELGAKVRAMLVATAAERWGVTPDQCRTANGVVYGPANRSIRYFELSSEAAGKQVPDKVRLKDPSEFRLIGKPVRRLDSRAKCTGAQKFALDLDIPGMKVAIIARPPVFGGRVRGFDDKDARRISGVRDVFEIPLVHGTAIAVVADRFWTAKQARDRLKIDWDLSGIEQADSSELRSRFKALAQTTGRVAVSRGDANAMDGIAAANRIDAEYEFPYLAHAPMEPLSTTVRFDRERGEVWAPSMGQTLDQIAVAEVLGLKPEQITYHTEFAGGNFGRVGPLDSHIAREAAAIAKRLRGIPVKVIWTREDDVQGGYYRTMAHHRVEVGIGEDGTPAAWKHVVVGQSFIIGSGNPFEAVLVKDGLDYLVVEGTVDTRYAIPNFNLSAHHPKINVPVLAWRSVGHTHNDFVMETLIDELALRAKIDPITYRLKLLDPDAKKHRRVLALLEEKTAAWRNSLPPGHAAGIACSEYHGTVTACAAEVSVRDGRPRVHRATVAVDCGLAVNPLSIESQYQGGLTFGMTQLVARGAISLKDGRVEQRNFDGYTPPFMADAPEAIDVHIVPSSEPPTAMGECPVPVISPAVVNALARITGKRFRSLPLVTL
jgi:isoquinoline 1-oxidoreductase beta subunit